MLLTELWILMKASQLHLCVWEYIVGVQGWEVGEAGLTNLGDWTKLPENLRKSQKNRYFQHNL